jgi:hypothetical protein
MLLVSAFCLLGVFRLARRVMNTEVAVGSAIALSFYPVFFAQSSMAHMDLGAAAFVLWGLDSYLANRRPSAIAFFSAAALTKETAIIVPLTLVVWELVERIPLISSVTQSTIGSVVPINRSSDRQITRSFALLLPALPLAAWFAFHYAKTGHVFGNPEFFHYNLADTLHPVRIFAAFLLRVWHLFGYMNMALLVAAVLLAMTLPPLPESPAIENKKSGVKDRIPIRAQLIFLVLILAHLLGFSVLGGAVLARYLLPVYPLVIILGVSTLRRRLPWWPAFLAVICIAFVISIFTEPPYRFAPEDNIAYTDYVRLHQTADCFLAQRFPTSTVLTAWPASDELTRPWLGYVDRPLRILRIENFSVEQMLSASDVRGQYQVALLFSTKEEPHLLLNFRWWERLQTRYFGYHRDLRPVQAAQLLGGRVVLEQHRGGQWVAVISLDTIENARVLSRHPSYSNTASKQVR